MKVKALAAAVALTAVAGTAQAGWDDGKTNTTFLGDGEFMLLAWDEVQNVSVIQDLGGSYVDFFNNNFSTGAEVSYQLDSLFDSTFATSNAANIRYSVIARNDGIEGVDGYNEPASAINGLMVTSNASAPTVDRSFVYGNMMNKIDGPLVNAIADNSDTAINNAYYGDTSVGPYAGSNDVYGRNIGQSVTFDTSAASTDSLYFWALMSQAAGGEDLQAGGIWTLNLEAGELKYAAVPVPAAVWLFASGLAGLGAIARRKKNA